LLLAASGAYAYTEAGVSGNTSSWESAEYKSDWGLVSMNASTAYSLGFNGSGTKIGVMDSGVLLNHPEFQDGRIHIVKTIGNYGKNGMRYPDAALGNGPIDKNQPVKDGKRNYDKNDNGVFKKGEAFNTDGSWMRGVNDAHGTHVGGTMAASRDGSRMHGVAFGAQLYSANTGGNDGMTYGPNQDYNFFLKGYEALADAGAKVINNSWGSNRRVNSSFAGALGYKPTYDWRAVPEYDVEFYDVKVANQTTAAKDHINLKDINEAKKAYYQFVTSGEKSFLDAAYEVAVKRGVIQVFTAGNRSLMAESFTRAALPYFRPDAEDYWVNVTGQTGADGYPNDSSEYIRGYKASSDIQEFNLAGHSKWWTIAAPAEEIYSAYVELTDNATYGKAIYKSSGGTSMAAPHVSGALGVIMQRYPYMSIPQVRETMLTTARQRTLRAGHGAGGMAAYHIAGFRKAGAQVVGVCDVNLTKAESYAKENGIEYSYTSFAQMKKDIQKPVLGIAMGDPAGVGPEIIAKLIANGFFKEFCIPVFIGGRKILERAFDVISSRMKPVSKAPAAKKILPGGRMVIRGKRRGVRPLPPRQRTPAGANAD